MNLNLHEKEDFKEPKREEIKIEEPISTSDIKELILAEQQKQTKLLENIYKWIHFWGIWSAIILVIFIIAVIF